MEPFQNSPIAYVPEIYFICRDTYMCVYAYINVHTEREMHLHCAYAILRNAKGEQSGRAGGLEYWTEMGAEIHS